MAGIGMGHDARCNGRAVCAATGKIRQDEIETRFAFFAVLWPRIFAGR